MPLLLQRQELLINLGYFLPRALQLLAFGANNDLAASAITVGSAAGTITKGLGSSDITVATRLSADGVLTINGGGSGTISLSGVGTDGGFVFNGENMAVGGHYFSADTIVSTSGDVTFNYGNGANGFIDVSAIQTVSAFTLTGSNLGTGNVVATLVSAEASISMDMGGMSGSAVIGTMNTDGDFTLNAGGAGNLNLNIEMISASGVSDYSRSSIRVKPCKQYFSDTC